MDLSKGHAKAAFEIARKLKDHGHTAYFAGGSVRDFVMEKDAHDIDIATSAVPDAIEALFKKTVPVGRQFGVILVESDDTFFEVATFRREGGYQDGRHPTEVSFTGPEEDARRRDFTVNGLFFDPFENKVIDYVGGLPDIKRRLIRAIGDPHERFEEDKLRLLRAVRFASTLNFDIEENTWKALRSRAAGISCVSPERIREELVKMLVRPNAWKGFQLLSDSGLMKEILPEIEAMKGVEQPPEHHPEGDVFVHTRMLLEKLKDPTPTLALSALFHDIAKPVTYAVKNGKICFYEHAPIGARMTRLIMKRLRFSNEDIDKVAEAVENHMKFADVQKMREGKLKLFVSRPNFSEEMELHRIDCLSSSGRLDNYQFLQSKLEQYANEPLKPPRLLTGNDLIALGMKPGPGMKPLLDEAYELQLEHVLKTKEEAVAWANSRMTGNKN